jgi:hypothetical protein
MRKLLIAALLAGQALGGSSPAFAQGFAPAQETQTGAFAGLRLRMPFGGANREPLRAGLAFAPTTRTETQDGRVRTRIGEGLEFGLRGREPMQFSIAGRNLRQLGAQGRNHANGRIPTGAWIAGGLVLVTVAVVVAAALVLEDAGDD